jgi:hypothetical protein
MHEERVHEEVVHEAEENGQWAQAASITFEQTFSDGRCMLELAEVSSELLADFNDAMCDGEDEVLIVEVSGAEDEGAPRKSKEVIWMAPEKVSHVVLSLFCTH